ncbi:hypothetical protein [Muriicola sp.]|uniref:hypothetical protein n=1 Tax=Muriicola sp. TaxID=2020856 RepID=UPI003C7464FA
MNKVFPVLFLFLVISCKSFRYDDRMIAFDFLNVNNKEVRLSGDFDEIELIDDDKIYIMCGYFRDWEIYPRSIITTIVVKKKYAFQTYGSVTSKEFGVIPLTTHNLRERNGYGVEIQYVMSLAEMDMEERKNRVLNDTIEIKLGELSFPFIPRTANRK